MGDCPVDFLKRARRRRVRRIILAVVLAAAAVGAMLRIFRRLEAGLGLR